MNLGMAIEYYREVAKSFPQYQESYKRVYKKLHNCEIKANDEPFGLWGAVKRIWKKKK